MSSFKRKMERNQKKQTRKRFKKKINELKKTVICALCEREPFVGENVDDWYIKVAEDISLACPECRESADGF